MFEWLQEKKNPEKPQIYVTIKERICNKLTKKEEKYMCKSWEAIIVANNE